MSATTNPKMIFHYPGQVVGDGTSGSQVRPGRMLKAFQELGYDVTVVAGDTLAREAQIEYVKGRCQRGEQFAFCYSESLNVPLLLAERGHMEGDRRNLRFLGRLARRRNVMDLGFLEWAHERCIPVGIFCRDTHWRMPTFAQMTGNARSILYRPLLSYDWRQYANCVDHLFLPAMPMLELIPGEWKNIPVSVLPPGCSPSPMKPDPVSSVPPKPLQLFYVGGITPPLYDLRPAFQALSQLKNVEFTLCCREEEWKEFGASYGTIDPAKLSVIHAHGNTLDKYYAAADIFFWIWGPHDYLRRTISIKTFEPMGHLLPTVTTRGTLAAELIQEIGIGWAVKNGEELVKLVTHINNHRELLQEKRQQIQAVLPEHTWTARAQQVATTLSEVA